MCTHTQTHTHTHTHTSNVRRVMEVFQADLSVVSVLVFCDVQKGLQALHTEELPEPAASEAKPQTPFYAPLQTACARRVTGREVQPLIGDCFLCTLQDLQRECAWGQRGSGRECRSKTNGRSVQGIDSSQTHGKHRCRFLADANLQA